MDAEIEHNYTVILRAGLAEGEADLFHALGHRILTEPPLIALSARKVDVSHPTYAEVDTFKKGDRKCLVLRIPHHLILTISGGDVRKSIGFTAD